ncbi:hypothetical protein ACZ87_03261, partial [Candidatus Erwinia dacicola]
FRLSRKASQNAFASDSLIPIPMISQRPSGDVQFIEQFRQATDHLVITSYPEGIYLKGFACRVL